jgi:hypothetical protein
VDFLDLSIPPNSDFLLLVGDRVQFHELFFFLIIVDGCDSGTDRDCNQDSEPLNPGRGSLISIGKSHLEGDRHYGRTNKDPEDEVIQGFTE